MPHRDIAWVRHEKTGRAVGLLSPFVLYFC